MADVLLQNILTRLMQRTLDNPCRGITMTGDGRLVCESFILGTYVCDFFAALGISAYPVQQTSQDVTEIQFGPVPEGMVVRRPRSQSVGGSQTFGNRVWANRQEPSSMRTPSKKLISRPKDE